MAITQPSQPACYSCHGSGANPSRVFPCRACEGTGQPPADATHER